jgi:hypothetical protein
MKHRSAMGKSVDMASLRSKNEKVRAVGNMSVNARGDIIDSNNQIISDVNHRVQNMYQKVVRPNTVASPAVKKVIASEKTVSEKEFDDLDEPNPEK